MSAATAELNMKENPGKEVEQFAIMRKFNDQTKVSVLKTSYILEPKNDKYFTADTSISKYPGSRKRWDFWILAVGGESDWKKYV